MRTATLFLLLASLACDSERDPQNTIGPQGPPGPPGETGPAGCSTADNYLVEVSSTAVTECVMTATALCMDPTTDEVDLAGCRASVVEGADQVPVPVAASVPVIDDTMGTVIGWSCTAVLGADGGAGGGNGECPTAGLIAVTARCAKRCTEETP